MSSLIDDLLHQSKFGWDSLPSERTSLDSLLNEVLSNLKITIAKTGAKITFDKLPTVTISPSQVSAVFQNLLDNAIKYHKPKEEPVVHISYRHQDGFHVIGIQDNGIGIEKEKISSIFKMFHRLNSSKKYPGEGIGLSSCKTVVERLGGKIWVESEVGKGTTVFFSYLKHKLLKKNYQQRLGSKPRLLTKRKSFMRFFMSKTTELIQS